MDLTTTLQYYRKRQGLSQVELAEALDVSRQTISKWETGAALPAAEHLHALSKLYGVTVDTLLNGAAEDAPLSEPDSLPEPAPLSVVLPSAPLDEAKPNTLPRRKLVLWMLAAVFICDFTAFFMDISLYSAKGAGGFLYYTQIFRLLSFCAIGLCFAWRDRFRPVSKRTSLLIAAAALSLGLYPALCSTPLLWRLYDWIVWSGFDSSELIFPPDPVRLFIGWTLCDSWAIFSHMSLIAAFQLGRRWFSRKKVQTLQPQTGQ